MATGLPNYKVILCGEYGVGKSSIFRRFMNNTFVNQTGKKSTIGLDQSSRVYNIGGTEVKVCMVRFSSVQLGSVQLGSVQFNSVRFSSVRFS